MSTMFSVSRLLGKNRSRSKRGLGATGSLVSLPAEKDSPKPPTSKLSNVVASNPQPPSYTPGVEPKPESIVELSSDTESASASSYYRTPLAENHPSNAPSKPNKSAGDGKDEQVEESGYTVIPDPETKPSDEWTHLDAPKDKESGRAAPKADPASAIKTLEDTIQKQKEELEQLWEGQDRAQMHIRDVEDERDRVQMHAQELDDELDRAQVRAQEAEEERDQAHKQAQDLEEERDRARIHARDVKAAQEKAQMHAQELEDTLKSTKADLNFKSQTLATLTASTRGMQSQIDSLKIESAGLREELALSKTAGTEEARRLQETLELERAEHDEQTAELRDQILRLTNKLDAQDDRIRRLERKVSDAEQEANKVYTRNQELEQQLARHEEGVEESTAEVEQKEEHIARLESGHEYMAAQLINLQNTLNATERENHMLVDQLRQQSSEANASRGLNRPPPGGLRVFSDKTSISGVSMTRIDSAVRAIKLLNDEIYQTAASMTEQLEGMAMRFVDAAREAGGHHHRRALAANLKSLLGTELVTSLGHGVSITDDDNNTFFIQLQTALQGCLIASCMRIITSWYPIEWEYGSFLVALYERIRGTDGQEKAFQWRKAAIKNCVPPPNLHEKIVALFTDDITKIIHLCGWGAPQLSGSTKDIISRFAPKLAEIAALALRVNKYTASGIVGELECSISEPGLTFDTDFMENDDDFHPGDRMYGGKRNAPLNEQVVCTVGLGLQLAGQVGRGAEQILLKPKVVLHSALF